MCGILGQIGGELNLPLFNEALTRLEHRGPDGEGIWSDQKEVTFGHRRLAIIDLTDGGKQPLEMGNYVLTFNGEIYNHEELRSKLPQYNYRGHSDTETITHALEVWGIRKTIEHLDGMFALAIHNIVSKELILARDFAGIKPLFYGEQNGQVVFGSQYDQVKAHPLFCEKINFWISPVRSCRRCG